MKRSLATAILLLALPACVDQPIPTPSLSRDLSVRPEGEAPTIPLAQIPLDSQGDFDALEESVLPSMGIEGLLPVMRALADGADPASRPEDALLLMRLALLELRAGDGNERLQRAFALADQLRTQAPNNPHGSFLVAEITRLLMRPGADHTFEITPRTKDIAKRLGEHLEHLLRIAPEYDGPHSRDGAQLAEELTALRSALAADASATPPPPTEAGSGIRVEDGVVTARSGLSRHETGTNVDRVTLCRDHVVDGFPAPDHPVGQWLLLRCAVTLDLAERGYTALRGLVQRDAIDDACAWVAKLPAGTPPLLADLNRVLTEKGQPTCARP